MDFYKILSKLHLILLLIPFPQIDAKEKELKQNLDLDIERKDRSMEEMAAEAEEYRKLFL